MCVIYKAAVIYMYISVHITADGMSHIHKEICLSYIRKHGWFVYQYKTANYVSIHTLYTCARILHYMYIYKSLVYICRGSPAGLDCHQCHPILHRNVNIYIQKGEIPSRAHINSHVNTTWAKSLQWSDSMEKASSAPSWRRAKTDRVHINHICCRTRDVCFRFIISESEFQFIRILYHRSIFLGFMYMLNVPIHTRECKYIRLLRRMLGMEM